MRLRSVPVLIAVLITLSLPCFAHAQKRTIFLRERERATPAV
jgi:hypothetical protein